MSTVQLTDLIAPSFYGVHHAVKRGDATHFLLGGGRGSTKSSFTPTEIILGLIQDPNANAIALRKVKDTLRESVYESFEWAIDKLGVSHLFDARVSPMQIIYRPTGQKIIFRGADNPIKIKSLRLRKGFFKFVWYEEADEFGIEDIRSINQTLLRGGDGYRVFYSYNPPKSRKRWVHEYRNNPPEAWLTHHSDYRSVPRHWLGEQFFLEAESLEKRNEKAYRHEYLGEDTGTGGEVFHNLTLRLISDEEIKVFDRIKRGLDFGFAAHPSHYAVMHFDTTRRRLYIFYELHKSGLANSPLAAAIKAENTANRPVTGDSEVTTLAQINNVIRVELDPNKPVPESCQVIQALIGMYPTAERLVILEAIREELGIAITQLKGAEPREQVRKNNGQSQNQRGLSKHKPRPGQHRG